jgi:hypothetical protein
MVSVTPGFLSIRSRLLTFQSSSTNAAFLLTWLFSAKEVSGVGSEDQLTALWAFEIGQGSGSRQTKDRSEHSPKSSGLLKVQGLATATNSHPCSPREFRMISF